MSFRYSRSLDLEGSPSPNSVSSQNTPGDIRIPASPTSPKQPEASTLQRNVIVSIWLIIILVCVYYLVINKSGQAWLESQLDEIVEWGFVGSLILVVVGVIFGVFGLPVSLFEIITACSLKDSFAETWLILTIGRTAASAMTFFIARYLARSYFEKKKDEYKILKSLEMAVEHNETKMVFILWFCGMPILLKHYLIPLFHISFKSYFIPGFLHSAIFACLMTYIGRRCHISGMSTTEIVTQVCVVIFSIGVFIYVYKTTKAELDRIEREHGERGTEMETVRNNGEPANWSV